VHTANMTITPLQIDLLGSYQQKNVKGVLLALELLQQKNWQISQKNIIDGLGSCKKNTGFMGRFDVLETKPMLICDVAHNAEGITEVLAQIKKIPHRQLHIILGFVSDKAVDKVLGLMPLKAQYYYTQAHIPRAMSKEILQASALQIGLQGALYENVNEALSKAKITALEDDVILICGSFFVIAELDGYYE
jgi:dihydrofolate synthase / folylpolyglutamate synthase